MRHPKGALVLPLVLILAVTSGSCLSGDAKRPDSRLPVPPGTVHVGMTEFYFVHPNAFPTGRVVFDVSNVGTLEHRLSLFRAPERGESSAGGLTGPDELSGVLVARMPALQPGESGRFAADLQTDAVFIVASLSVGADGVTDAAKGMVLEFRAGGRVVG